METDGEEHRGAFITPPVPSRLSQTAWLNDALHLRCEVLLWKNSADKKKKEKANNVPKVPVVAPAWRSIHEENVEETKSRSAYLRLCTSWEIFFSFFFNLEQNVCVCVSLECTCCLSWKKKDGQPELQDERGWKGCLGLLSPDKTHLFGLGLPLLSSPQPFASFSALGLSHPKPTWKTGFRQARLSTSAALKTFVSAVNYEPRKTILVFL